MVFDAVLDILGLQSLTLLYLLYSINCFLSMSCFRVTPERYIFFLHFDRDRSRCGFFIRDQSISVDIFGLRNDFFSFD